MALALAMAGIVLVAYGVTIMAVGSGTGFFVVWYAAGGICLAFSALVRLGVWATAPTLLRRVVVACACAGLAVVIGVGALAASGMNATCDDDLDVIIVLGAQVKTSGPSTVLRYRLDTAYDYLAAHPNTTCIVSGGQNDNEPTSEAAGMAAYLVGRGIDEDRIVLEDASTNTVENIRNSMALLDSTDRRVGIVTNDFHVYRSVAIAHRQGLEDAVGIAAPSRAWYLPNNLLREVAGIIKDTLLGNM